MRHVNIIGLQIRRLRNEHGWSQDDLPTKLQRAEMEDGTRSNVSKLDARLIRAIDEARMLRVELIELYPERIRLALDLYEAIRRAKASRFGLIFFTTLTTCFQIGAGALDFVARLGREHAHSPIELARWRNVRRSANHRQISLHHRSDRHRPRSLAGAIRKRRHGRRP
jgi:hypothetical protein